MFKPIQRKSVADDVYQQLKSQIVDGTMEPGSTLPAERVLSEMLGVNRGAIREALKRLEQARLVAIRHGGGTRVLDFRQTAGLGLLTDLLLRSDGTLDTAVLRSIMEMRSAIGPDAARLAAHRGGSRAAETLLSIEERMVDADESIEKLQLLGIEYWNFVVHSSGNVAYQLAYNTLNETYSRYRNILTQVMAREVADIERHRAVRIAIGEEDGETAARLAALILQQGQQDIERVLQALDAVTPQQ